MSGQLKAVTTKLGMAGAALLAATAAYAVQTGTTAAKPGVSSAKPASGTAPSKPAASAPATAGKPVTPPPGVPTPTPATASAAPAAAGAPAQPGAAAAGATQTAAADPAAGRELFNNWGCSSCHSLADAGAAGHVGPELDGNAGLTQELVVNRVTNGQGAMPAFGGQLSDAEIKTLAAYIVQVKK